MLKKVIKWTLIVLGSIIIIVAVIIYGLISSSNKKMNKKWEVTPASIPIPPDSASVARGEHLAGVFCMDCHGDQFQGKTMIDDPDIGKIEAHNLTSGKGGVGGKYTDVDWVRAIRHGINKDGRALFIMPANAMHNLCESDVADIVAYMKTIPPVDHVVQERPQITKMAKVLAAIGAFGDVWSAESIDHDAAFEVAPASGPTSEYGEYLVNSIGCRHCHGEQLNGGKSPEPHAPFVPNLTPGGDLGTWSNEQFTKVLRTGWLPNGRQLSPQYMPWKATSRMSDDEITAIYEYLKKLPKLETAKE